MTCRTWYTPVEDETSGAIGAAEISGDIGQSDCWGLVRAMLWSRVNNTPAAVGHARRGVIAHSPPMRLVAIVEVPSLRDSEMPSDLLRAAYQASRSGPVALLLPVGASSAVDRELDALVAANRHVHGVSYGRLADAGVWKSASSRTVVIGSSSDAKRHAAAIGVGCLDQVSGLAALHRLGADPTASQQPERRAS